jgi:AraC-like DNA-binding protein
MDNKFFQIAVNEISQTDLIFYHCGLEDCFPGKSFGPTVRDHYLVHYICKGKGIFILGKKTYHLEAGQGFLICPGDSAFYQADSTDPWEYAWVGFSGANAGLYLQQADLGPEHPVFWCEDTGVLKRLVDQMLETHEHHDARELRLVGLLNIFLSELIEMNKGSGPEADDNINTREAYVKKAIKFIYTNYSRKINVADIAFHVGLDGSYLGVVFKKVMQVTPYEYLIGLRIERACALMADPSLNLSDIARSVGYEDPFIFSKIFKKKTGKSPREYRKTVDEEKPHQD